MSENKTITLGEISQKESEWVVKQFLAAFLNGEIEAYNSSSNMRARGLRSRYSEQPRFSYIEACLSKPVVCVPRSKMPRPVPKSPVLQALAPQRRQPQSYSSPLKGKVALEKTPRGYDQYGKCRIEYGLLMDLPVLFFELHKRKTRALAAIPEGKSVVLRYPYTKRGAAESIEEALITITNDAYAGLVVAAEFEGRYCRGIDKRMRDDLRDLLVHYAIKGSEFEGQILLEELFFHSILHADLAFSHYKVPHLYSAQQDTAKSYLYHIFSHFMFNANDAEKVVNGIHEQDLVKPTFQKPEGVFKRENGYCYINYKGREYQIKDYQGMDFIQTILCSEDELSHWEIMQTVRQVCKDSVSYDKSYRFSKSEVEESEKLLQSSREKLKRELKEAQIAGDHDEVKKAEDLLEKFDGYILKLKFEADVPNSTINKAVDNVRTATARSIEKLKSKHPELGGHLEDSLLEVGSLRKKNLKYIYRPKQPMKWVMK
nr:hypothetical protein [uncultured Pseudodesulfovibrio sp.]